MGFKLVAKRAIRAWAATDKFLARAMNGLGYDGDKVFVKKLRSPAQMEKIMSPEAFEEITEYIKKDSSGTTLVRDSDKRPAVKVGPQEDFDCV